MTTLDKKYNFLRPKKFKNLKRYGRKADGGYVCEETIVKNTNTLVTFGMGPDWSFELDYIKDNSNVKIFMYDYTVTALPYIKDLWKYFRRFVTFRGKLKSLTDRWNYLSSYLNFFKLKNVNFYSEKITFPIKNKIDADIDKVFNRIDLDENRKNKPIILKSDIEGSEFEVIDGIVKYSNRIDALIFEFHWLDRNEDIFLESIKKLQVFFDIAHIHANNHCDKLNTGLPITLEMTLINKKYNSEKNESVNSFPIQDLDFPNNPTKDDLFFKFSS
jgi:hypothetical protein